MAEFFLSRAGRTMRTGGVRAYYHEVSAALRALRNEETNLVVGALPFDPRTPAALIAPEFAEFRPGPFLPKTLPPLPRVSLTEQIPSREAHISRVSELIELLRGGTLRKVVAARSVRLEAERPIDPMTLVSHLVAR